MRQVARVIKLMITKRRSRSTSLNLNEKRLGVVRLTLEPSTDPRRDFRPFSRPRLDLKSEETLGDDFGRSVLKFPL